jgi:hypothetical protein
MQTLYSTRRFFTDRFQRRFAKEFGSTQSDKTDHYRTVILEIAADEAFSAASPHDLPVRVRQLIEDRT